MKTITIDWRPPGNGPRVYDNENGLRIENDIPAGYLAAFRRAGRGDELTFEVMERPIRKGEDGLVVRREVTAVVDAVIR